jgi:hypothetical protein
MNQLAAVLGSTIGAATVMLAFAIVLVCCLEIGRRIAQRELARSGDAARAGAGVVEGAICGLFALLIGFSFSGAATRFETRRHLIISEANAISTVWLRLDLLPSGARDTIRGDVQRYLDALIAIHRDPIRSERGEAGEATLTSVQSAIWENATAATARPPADAVRLLVLNPVNDMFDAADTERSVRIVHPPLVVYIMLGLTAFATTLLAGHAMGSSARNWLLIVGMALSIALAGFATLELEYPHLGIVRIDRSDRALESLRERMK